jgi:hypothetical protein
VLDLLLLLPLVYDEAFDEELEVLLLLPVE